ncbi:MAG: zinc ribbon domain-containing protein, partial [Acidimicrobiia bacterium]
DRYRPEPVGGSAVTDKAFMDLLDLQAVDTEIDQLLNTRQSLPELEAFKVAHGRRSELQGMASEQGAALAETVSALKKAEGELELKEKKRGSEEMRMFAGGMSSKDLANLQQEVEMLGRQIETAEEEILGLLDVRDQQEAELAETSSQLEEVEAEASRLESAIATEWKQIDGQVAERQARRPDFLPLIPTDLLDLYEKLRPAKDGVGAVRLAEGVCGGCHLSLSPAEQHEVLKDDPPRCLQCRRILVPQ